MAVPLHQALGRIVLVLLHLALVPDDLAVQFVDKFINGGVQILVRTLRKEIATLDMDVAFGALSFFLFFLLLHGKQHFDINDLVKMPGDPIKLGGHVGTQGRGDFEMVTADRQVHEEPPVALWVEKAAFSSNGQGNRILPSQ
jgi:hypothetical protein